MGSMWKPRLRVGEWGRGSNESAVANARARRGPASSLTVPAVRRARAG